MGFRGDRAFKSRHTGHPLEETFLRYGDLVENYLKTIQRQFKDLEELPEPRRETPRPFLNPFGGT